MAVVTETFIIGEREFVRTYSDQGMKIHGGFPEGNYDEATDPAEFGRTYTETNIPVDADIISNADGDKAIEILDTLLGE